MPYSSAEWLEHQWMLSCLLSWRCPFYCQHDKTDDGTPARRCNYCPTVPVLSHHMCGRPIPLSFSMTSPRQFGSSAEVSIRLTLALVLKCLYTSDPRHFGISLWTVRHFGHFDQWQWGASQFITRSTRLTVKSCDELIVMSDNVVTNWPYFLT